MTVTEAAVIFGLAANVIAIVVAILKVGQAIGKFEAIGAQQAMEIKDLKVTTAKIGDVLKDLAVQSNRQDTLEKQQVIQAQQIEDLRRGEGFILPLPMGQPRSSQT